MLDFVGLEPVSSGDRLFLWETRFWAQRQREEFRLHGSASARRRPPDPRQPRQSGPILPFSGKVSASQNAWWAREDLNLQPDRYERSALTIELRARHGDATFYQCTQVSRNRPSFPGMPIG